MADKELGALSPIDALLAAALFHTVQEGNSRKVTAQQIADFVNGNYPAFIQALLSAQSAEDVYTAIGTAPDADKLGGQSPTFFASADAVENALQDVNIALAEKVPASRKVAGKSLTGDITLAKEDVGLGNANDTSDENKPVSIAQQTALDLKITAPVESVTVGNFAQFTTVDGKTISEAQIGSPALLGRVSAGVGPVERLTKSQANQIIGGWEHIGSFQFTNYPSIVVPNLAPFYLIRVGYRFVAATSVNIRLSTDNGATFVTDAGSYAFNLMNNRQILSTGENSIGASNGTIAGFSLGDAWTGGEILIHAFNVGQTYATSVGTQRIRNETTGDLYTRTISHQASILAARNALQVATANGSNMTGFFCFEGVRG